jgi:nucleoside-diphosphate-sugar epimerase
LRVFVTGHRGYIGSHLVELLREEGFHVVGCDLNLFDDCESYTRVPPHEELVKDVREVTPRDLDGIDAVMHLAAISNDPMGDLDEQLTRDVNFHGSVHMAETAKRAGVERFLFAGSCSVYGKGPSPSMTEQDALAPLSVYARSKVDAEQAISELADSMFSPIFLRNATAFGDSPMLRIDLVANNLLACALVHGEIRIMSDGSPWRPLIHCRDIAHAFVALAKAPRDRVHNQVINVGGNVENYQVRDVADRVQELVPRANVVYTGEVGSDPRDYRVNFDRLRQLLPDFRLEFDLRSGLHKLHERLVRSNFDRAAFEGDRFVRLRTIRKRLDRFPARTLARPATP